MRTGSGPLVFEGVVFDPRPEDRDFELYVNMLAMDREAELRERFVQALEGVYPGRPREVLENAVAERVRMLGRPLWLDEVLAMVGVLLDRYYTYGPPTTPCVLRTCAPVPDVLD